MEEQLLRQLVENTRPKSGISFVVSNTNSRIKTHFNPPLELEGKNEIALMNLETYYSFPNITEKNNMFRYSPDNGKNWFEFSIQPGAYELNQINTEIQRQMSVNKHFDATQKHFYITIGTNTSTLKSI